MKFTDDEISRLLNDSEMNFLADLFLACYNIDRGTRTYRRLRNSVLLVPYSTNGMHGVCEMLSCVENVSAANIEADLNDCIRSLATPPAVTFNAHYNRGDKDTLRMPENLIPNDVILFLGTAFVYLLNVNYRR